MYDADNTAINLYGIPSVFLMQNAAGHLARAALELMGKNKSAVVFCGPGNNGGDGVGAAIILHRHNVRVRALLVGRRERMSGETREMEFRLNKLGGVLESFRADDPTLAEDLANAGAVVDAVFGIGLSRALPGDALRAVRMMNESPAPVVCADIPSGVEADTGRVLGEAVRCARTVTFSRAKIGHFAEPGCSYCGRVEPVAIGIPAELLQNAGYGVFALTKKDVSLPARPPLSHKGSYGKLLIVGGSVGYTGAPSLCARAAVRSGAGLVYLGVPSAIYEITAVKNDEAMPFPLVCDADGRILPDALPAALKRLAGCDNGVVGPGRGRSGGVRNLVLGLVESAAVPLVVDADGLWALAGNLEILRNAPKPVILTPHEGEFARLGGVLTGDRVGDARRFAEDNACVLVLKGHRTICAFPGGEVTISTTGNAGMAKGGTGDVLAGVIGALLGQLPLRQAVTTGVWIHGAAGDLCAEEIGQYGMTPSDIVEALPEITKKIVR
jgi:NAD(P)H-hydrate epimerase